MTIKEYEQAQEYMTNINAAKSTRAVLRFLLEHQNFCLAAISPYYSDRDKDLSEVRCVPEALINYLITATEKFEEDEIKKMQEL